MIRTEKLSPIGRMEIWNEPFVMSRAPLQTLWGSSVKLGRSRLPASAWLSCSTSYMLYDGFPISTLIPPLVMGCLWTRFPLRSHGAWLKWLLSFSQFSGFILQTTDLSSAAAAGSSLFIWRLVVYLLTSASVCRRKHPLPPPQSRLPAGPEAQ